MIHPSEVARAGAAPAGWVEEVESGLGFAGLRREWNELLASSNAGPFLSWEWLYPWWRRVSPSSTPRILLARDGQGRLEAVLPLCETRLGGELGIRRWGFLGDSHVGSDYLEVLAPAGRERELTERMAAHLAARMDRCDVLELFDLPAGSLLGDALLARLAGRSLRAERFERFQCPMVEVQGSFQEYLDKVGRAENLSRRKKWLAGQPGFAIEVARQPQQVGDALAHFFRLHRLRWAQDGGSQGIQGPQVRAFHRDATAYLAEAGRLWLYTLRLGEQPLASVYGIVHGGRFYYYQSGYDPQWARRSVGLVLLGRTLEDAFGQKVSQFDFLRGLEPYKSEWANARRQTEGVRLVNRTAAGLAWLAGVDGRLAVRRAAKKVLGRRGWELLSRWARTRAAAG